MINLLLVFFAIESLFKSILERWIEPAEALLERRGKLFGEGSARKRILCMISTRESHHPPPSNHPLAPILLLFHFAFWARVLSCIRVSFACVDVLFGCRLFGCVQSSHYKSTLAENHEPVVDARPLLFSAFLQILRWKEPSHIIEQQFVDGPVLSGEFKYAVDPNGIWLQVDQPSILIAFHLLL